MRELSAADLGMLLSVFAVLLIAFGIDFHVSRRSARQHRGRALFFVGVSLVGEAMTALALVLTWIALWSPAAWEQIDDLLVFIPGSIAVLCAVVLTGEKTVGRVLAVRGHGDGSTSDR
ncbi:hypothetical protein [Microbacterium pygmaeum]|uniref:Uncharacterized protein n=1 Tax=Microbacterium pygmaeum TaxID=370764 RepID=A0A1G8B0Y4_9MICO|nr:hypothetical protein [Microbacterium pygmaeum]SDH26942.1 hypothetical protein SAMN04489810_2557 [Microbacterium pygmaeum]